MPELSPVESLEKVAIKFEGLSIADESVKGMYPTGKKTTEEVGEIRTVVEHEGVDCMVEETS